MSTVFGQTVKPWTKPAYHYVRSTDKLPSTDVAYELEDPLCRVKLFNPTGAGTWYIAGFDPETGLGYGVAHIFETESGDFDLNEIRDHRGMFGLPVERDLWFKPTRVSVLLAEGR